ncbi:MAG: M20 metallopeptidase family protein [Usitatibacter sp.]
MPKIAAAALLFAFSLIATAQDLARRAESLIDQVEPRVIEWRRHVHANPELSYEEFKTAQYIAQALRAMPGMEVTTGIAKTGVKAVLRGARPGPVVALRADMDALPVEEKTGLPFASRTKAMWQGKETFVAHACGHDTHVAMLLGVAQVLSQMRGELRGTVVFLFQPAEEWGEAEGVPSGATQMVKDGVLLDPKVDAVLGQHVGFEAPAGSIRYRSGAIMASGDDFRITVKGKGTHGAYPWNGKDPIIVAAEIAVALQTIVSRELDLVENGPAVVSVGAINGGNRENIIPEEAVMIGTIRTLSETSRVQARESLKRKAEKIAEASGLTAQVAFTIGYPVLSNNPALMRLVMPALERAAGPGKMVETPPILAAEDFGAYGASIPAVYWFLAASPLGDKPGAPNHSPFFTVDESVLRIGMRAMVGATLAFLQVR